MKGDRRAALAEQLGSWGMDGSDCDCAFLKKHGDQPRGKPDATSGVECGMSRRGLYSAVAAYAS
jgi:hypothetical protein